MMFAITLFIIWAFLALIIDGWIMPELARQYLPNGVELWMYGVYLGVALLLLLYIYYKIEVDDNQ